MGENVVRSTAMLTVQTFSPLPCIRGYMSQGTYGRLVGWSLVLLLAWPILVWAATPDAFDAVHYQVDVTYDAAAHTRSGQASRSTRLHPIRRP